MKKNFMIALCQMKVVDDKKKNQVQAVKMIKKAGKTADLVVLPEMFNCPYDIEKFPEYAEESDNSPTLSEVSWAAKKANVYLVAGSIPEREGKHVYNSSFFFNPQGEIIGSYRKMHLFDIDVPGEISFKESETLSAGDQLTVVKTDLGKIGICICYDMRFPELLRLMTLQGAQLIVVPGAFNLTTGPVHWEPLIRVRAIDNQVYMAAASPARDKTASYVAYGHSMLVDPWGTVLAKASSLEEIIYSEIDLSYLEKVRKDLPLLRNRRTDIYQLEQKDKSDGFR
jgi:predicted amidohydrolase